MRAFIRDWTLPLEQREGVIARIEKRRQIDENGCWIWTGSKLGNYGGIQVCGEGRMVHRVSYEAYVGAIPSGLTIDHLCLNKLCVNPAHLEPVTAGENKRREYESRGVCANGLHPKTPENTYEPPGGGQRRCKPCMSANHKRYYRRKLGLVAAPSEAAQSPRLTADQPPVRATSLGAAGTDGYVQLSAFGALGTAA